MNQAELEQAKANMVRPWLVRAQGLIARRFADARAHAQTGSLMSAATHLRDLTRDLAGPLDKPPVIVDLEYEGLVGKARNAFYRDSFSLQRRRLDPELHDLDLKPEPEDVYIAIRHPIGGIPFYHALSDLIDDEASRSLTIAMSIAGGPETSPGVRAAVFESWEKTNSEKVMRRVERELKTAAISLYEAVGRLMLRPEYR